jgi:hypothetical protein
MLDRLDVDETTYLLDPWNGGGTTTAAAAERGIEAVGFDLNPASVLIGRSRLLPADIASSLVPLGKEIRQHALAYPMDMDSDPLGIWFGPNTMRQIRSLERAIHTVLVNEGDQLPSQVFDPRLPQSSLAAVFYVSLFDMVRQLAHRYVPSNPTWIKQPDGRRIGVPIAQLHEAFAASIQRLTDYLEKSPQALSATAKNSHVAVASSTDLPLPDAGVDAVISSPPYCTRIDYVKATFPELAVLGLREPEIRDLRDKMIGTPTMASALGNLQRTAWGKETNALLTRIESHSSKASAGYYRKYYLQYFTGMWASLLELRRVMKPDKSAVLVLQDSYYKDVHVDLPMLIGDMSQAAGWSKWSRIDFEVSQTMATIHTTSRSYGRPLRPVESAIIIQR